VKDTFQAFVTNSNLINLNGESKIKKSIQLYFERHIIFVIERGSLKVWVSIIRCQISK
jgi:hypothetical protein